MGYRIEALGLLIVALVVLASIVGPAVIEATNNLHVAGLS